MNGIPRSLLGTIKVEFAEAWRFWRPAYIATGIAIGFAVLLVLADMIYRSLP